MSAEDLISGIISTAQSLATATVTQATGYANDAQLAATEFTDLGTLPVPVKPIVPIPNFVPGTSDVVSEFQGNFDGIFGRLDPEFTQHVNDLITEFFPTMNSVTNPDVDAWLHRAIAVGGTGIPPIVEAQIYERGRNREIKDFNRRTEELISNWAERGFQLPPGALYEAEQNAQQDLTEKTVGFSRDVLIKVTEIEIQNVRFAVEQGIKLRLGAIEAVVAYLRAWLEVSRIAVEYADAVVRTRLGLYGAVVAYYNALIASASLTYKWGQDQAEIAVRGQANFVEVVKSNTAARVNAAISAAQTVGSIGAAVLAAQTTMAHISNDTIVQG